jgi:hypothetical protein
MRAMATSLAALLDTGKEQGIRSVEAQSWRANQTIYCEGEGRETMIACHQAERLDGPRSVLLVQGGEVTVRSSGLAP